MWGPPGPEHTTNIIYIYIEREREKQRETEKVTVDSLRRVASLAIIIIIIRKYSIVTSKGKFYIGSFVLLKFIEPVRSINFSNRKPPM